MGLQRLKRLACVVALVLAFPAPASAQSEIPKTFSPVTDAFDHERRVVEIPMRDGVKLHTVIVIPRNGAKPAPIILTRTPYGADKPTTQSPSPNAAMVLPAADESLLNAGYIRVYQDVRGRYGSQGDYVMTLPVRGPLNKWKVDQTTDTYDTIDWLVKNVPGNNGRVGITGVSYPGWLTLMGILDPHPALKAAVPMYPMVDGWIGDDFYHNGALRQTMFEWIYQMGSDKSSQYSPPFGYRDMYEAYLSAGSADGVARRYKADQLPTWRKIVDNPTYNAFWQGQAVQNMLAKTGPKLPVLLVHGLFDQEDNFGGIAAYEALEAQGPQQRHGLSCRRTLEPRPVTGRRFLDRRDEMGRQHEPLVPREGAASVLGPAFEGHCAGPTDAAGDRLRQRIERVANLSKLASRRPGCRAATLSGPGRKPVLPSSRTARERPMRNMCPTRASRCRTGCVQSSRCTIRISSWSNWLVDDQRPFSDRPDVLTFVSEPLAEPLTISGAVAANLFASTTGTDSDWVVKLIDVYPPEVRSNPGTRRLSADGLRRHFARALSRQPRAAQSCGARRGRAI